MIRNKIATKLLEPINPSGVLILGIFTALWGLWVANPFWNVFSSADLYEKMSILPESVWGMAAIIIGILIILGTVRNHYDELQRGAMAGFYHWFVIAVFYFMGDWHNTGGIVSLMIAVYCAFIALNLRVNRKILPFNNPNGKIRT